MNGNATSKKKQSSSEESSESSDDEKDDTKKTTTAVKRKRETSETDEISSKKAKNNTSLNNGTSSKPNTPKNNVINEPFRRVKSENVHIKKAELRDNSYKEVDTWGNKANKDLIVTQGKSFRHEKTKKKRGSYRGGQINVGVNSVKFDSD